MTINMLVIIRC